MQLEVVASACVARAATRWRCGRPTSILRPDGRTRTTRSPGRIHRRMFHGDFIQYVVDWPAGQLIVRRPPTELFEEGSEVTVSFAPEHCVLL